MKHCFSKTLNCRVLRAHIRRMDQLRGVCSTYAKASSERTIRQPYHHPGYGDPHAPVPFVILSQQRSGTHLTSSLLRHHPRVRAMGESFHPGTEKWLLNLSAHYRAHHREEWMDLILSENQGPLAPPANQSAPLAVGFIAQPWHLTLSEFAALALAPTVRKIVIRRVNLIEMYVSRRKAERNSQWKSENTTAMTVSVQPSELRKYIRTVESNNRCLDQARRLATENGGAGAWLDVDYDELADEGGRGAALLARMYAHLQVPPVPDPRLPDANLAAQRIATKQNYAWLNYSISNYDQLWKALAYEPRYQAMMLA